MRLPEVVLRFLRIVPAVLAVSLGLTAAYSDYSSVKEKLSRIESDRLPAGSRVDLSAPELNAYVEREVAGVTDGVRNPKLELLGPEMARGTAQVDFAKVRRSQGHPPGWLMSKLLEGERPVTVTARIRSGGGSATVTVQRVEISGLAIDGKTLDFLVQNCLLPLYPNATVNRPFSLGHRIQKLDIQASGVKVLIGR